MRTARVLSLTVLALPVAFVGAAARAQPDAASASASASASAPSTSALPPSPATSTSTAPTPESTPAEPPEARGEDERWRYDYRIARERLLAGDFVDAADRFQALAGAARQPLGRALAANMRDLAKSWADRGLALVKQSELGESTLSAKSVNERTTDEIAQLYISSILYGIGTGIWLDVHTQAQNPAPIILPMIGFAGLAVGGVALFDIGHPLHYGVPQSIVSGLNIGLEEGIVLALWNQTQTGSQWSGQTAGDVVWSLSTLGAAAGGVIGATTGTTPGRASFVGSAALWTGLVTGLVAAAATPSNDNPGSNGLLAGGIGLNVGVVGGLLVAAPVSPTIGRVRFLDIGGLGGSLLFGGLTLALSGNGGSVQVFSAMTALGAVTGLGIAWFATSKMPSDRPLGSQGSDTHALVLQPMIAPVVGGATLGVSGSL
jgi:hypothetical protein